MAALKYVLLFACLGFSMAHAITLMDQVPERGCVKVKVQNSDSYWPMYFERTDGTGSDGESLYLMASARADGCGAHPHAKGVLKTKSEILQYLLLAGMIQLNPR